MKSKGSLTFILVTSIFAAEILMGADAPKKAAPAKPAAPATKAPAATEAKPGKAPAAASKSAAEAAPAAKGDDSVPDVVAVVEGMEVKKAELDKVIAGVMQQQGGTPADIPAEQKAMIYRKVLDDVIVDKLINKRAAEIKVEDAEVEGTIARIKKNFGTEEEFNAQVAKTGQTLDKVKEDIRGSLRQQHWVEDQIKGKAEVTDADVEDFYKKNPDQFKTGAQVRASHILVAVAQDAKPETVVEKEKAAKDILARVKKGEDFDKLAKELSEDPSAKENGGDLNFFGREQMVPEFSEAAFKMKDGDVSDAPVRSQFGYHIIKVTGHKDAETVTLDKAKPQLQAYLTNQKKQAEIEKVVRTLREKAEVKINLPEPKLPAGLPGAPGADASAPVEAVTPPVSAPAPK